MKNIFTNKKYNAVCIFISSLLIYMLAYNGSVLQLFLVAVMVSWVGFFSCCFGYNSCKEKIEKDLSIKIKDYY